MENMKCPCCGNVMSVHNAEGEARDLLWCGHCSIGIMQDSVAPCDCDAEMECAFRNVSVGQLYRHFKGGMYRVVGVANHTETGDPLVVYHEEGNGEKLWVRPLSMFTSAVDRDKYPNAEQSMRFELISI